MRERCNFDPNIPYLGYPNKEDSSLSSDDGEKNDDDVNRDNSDKNDDGNKSEDDFEITLKFNHQRKKILLLSFRCYFIIYHSKSVILSEDVPLEFTSEWLS